ncbi:hypothetical protein [Commensalibacter papalotli (ex Botero et al. 2024)]|nr:hypothetical protein [Commensalibacter papalotli (ex Botero et al. 2024)]CAI3931461.1 unnamed protein product [Commensalibacter papalotli (ex Botero et al. 2024)]
MRFNMGNSEFFIQLFQYLLGIISVDIAGDIVAVVTVIVMLCT